MSDPLRVDIVSLEEIPRISGPILDLSFELEQHLATNAGHLEVQWRDDVVNLDLKYDLPHIVEDVVVFMEICLGFRMESLVMLRVSGFEADFSVDVTADFDLIRVRWIDAKSSAGKRLIGSDFEIMSRMAVFNQWFKVIKFVVEIIGVDRSCVGDESVVGELLSLYKIARNGMAQ